MIKISYSQDGSVAYIEECPFKQEILDLDINDVSLDLCRGVLTDKTGKIIRGKLTLIDDISEKYMANAFAYVVNITTENKKKVATVIENNPNDSVELDFDRGDRGFNSLEEAEAYANTFNS